MKTINIHNAKTNLSKLLVEVSNGEDIIIAKSGVPTAVLSAYTKKKATKPGALKGKIKIKKDFDIMPEEFLEHFTK